MPPHTLISILYFINLHKLTIVSINYTPLISFLTLNFSFLIVQHFITGFIKIIYQSHNAFGSQLLIGKDFHNEKNIVL